MLTTPARQPEDRDNSSVVHYLQVIFFCLSRKFDHPVIEAIAVSRIEITSERRFLVIPRSLQVFPLSLRIARPRPTDSLSES